MFLLPLLLLASHAASATILQDRSDLWVGSWDLGAWKWDSSEVERSVKAVAYTIDGRPGAILSPVLHGTIALPPNGSWTVSVQRDSLVELGAHAWKRATVWSKTPPYRTVVSPTSPAAWEEMKTPNGHLLRLSVPWLEVSPEGKGQLARHIKVTVHMSGTGSAPLEPTVEGLILNPSGGGRFGFASVSRKAGRSLMSSPRLLPQGDQCLVLKVRANTAGDLSQDRVVKITGSMLFSALGNISGVDFDHVAVACGGRGPIPLVTDSVAVDPSLAAIPIHRVDINGN